MGKSRRRGRWYSGGQSGRSAGESSPALVAPPPGSGGREKVQAKKILGQHFLISRSAALRIAECLHAGADCGVVEIGPGMGAITEHLLSRFGERLYCLEVDEDSFDYLKTHYWRLGDRLIWTDCLEFDFAQIPFARIALVGNLPYNISSQILFLMLSLRDSVEEGVFMLQKEVADRIASSPGSKQYGILSVLLQAYFEIETVLQLSPHDFDPPPQVRSSVLRFSRNAVQQLDCDDALFTRVVKTAFNQRRKTLRNSLFSHFAGNSAEFSFADQRAESLSVADFVLITRELEAYMADRKAGASHRP